jgi:hypothetical protein
MGKVQKNLLRDQHKALFAAARASSAATWPPRPWPPATN